MSQMLFCLNPEYYVHHIWGGRHSALHLQKNEVYDPVCLFHLFYELTLVPYWENGNHLAISSKNLKKNGIDCSVSHQPNETWFLTNVCLLSLSSAFSLHFPLAQNFIPFHSKPMSPITCYQIIGRVHGD